MKMIYVSTLLLKGFNKMPKELETLRNLVDINTVIGISTKESLSISTPSQTKTIFLILSRCLRWFQFLYNTLTLQIPDHDATARRGTEPVSCR